MKITFVSPNPNLSGGLRVVALYADRLMALGHDVVVVASRPWQKGLSRKDKLRAFIKGRFREHTSLESHYDTMKAPLKLVDHDGPLTTVDIPDADVVIATWWETAFMVANLPVTKGRKFYFVQHHEIHHPMTQHLSAGSYHLPLKKIIVASWIADVIPDNHDGTPIAVVPNSVDLDLFHAAPRGKQARPTVGLMYSLTEFKGLDISLAAIARLREAIPDLHLIVFGKQARQPEHPLPEGTTFHYLPAQEKLRDIYASCDVFLFGSRSEGFGLPVLEAMACGCPVVGTRTGCAPDVIEPGVSGYLADIDDADGLARGMQAVLETSDQDWRVMSLAALERAKGYSWDDAVRLFEKVLTDTD